MPDIRDITDPTEFIPEPTTPLWIWALVAASVVTTILLICFIVRKRKTNQTRRDLLDKARAKLSELKDQSASLKPEMIATRISVILRQYLEAAFEDPALFETNEEFTLRPTALERIHPDVRPQITSNLEQLSELKYEPNKDHDTAHTIVLLLISDAQKILAHSKIHPILEHRN